ncbi:MAG: hypothetical protein F4003_08910 [Acidimicrobiaceae bacterium]|nr:hypothetical protein [Acidimicrobiaceae bacterium]MYC41011.1 hypothetical protein [Acidimicrobiaceae bacterium]
MTPVKTKPISRHMLLKLRMWEIGLRMKELRRNPDVWLLESPKPTVGSPWEQTQIFGRNFERVNSLSLAQLAKLEGELRLEAAQDYFAGLRSTARTRSVYSVYVMSRSTIEACAFAAWVFDPKVQPGERILRGLLLREQSLEKMLRSLRAIKQDHSDELDSEYVAEMDRVRSEGNIQLLGVKRAVRGIHAGLGPTSGPLPERSQKVPSSTKRIREMLFDEMEMPQGLDAYPRMSGVAHSEALAITSTWNSDGGKPSIDYYDFLVYLHLALCAIDHSLTCRAACWGETYKSSGLHKVIDRVERILDGEPNVKMI